MSREEIKTKGKNFKAVEELLSTARTSLEDEDYASSVSLFLKIIKRDPNSADARFGLGDAYFGLADYANAENTYRLGLELFPKNSDGLFGLAATLRVIESYNEAIELYERAFDVDPNRTAAYWELAYSREMTGDTIGAEHVLKITPTTGWPNIFLQPCLEPQLTGRRMIMCVICLMITLIPLSRIY